jgi:hypothetical protein
VTSAGCLAGVLSATRGHLSYRFCPIFFLQDVESLCAKKITHLLLQLKPVQGHPRWVSIGQRPCISRGIASDLAIVLARSSVTPPRLHAARQLCRCHVRRLSHHGLLRTCNQLRHPACSFKEMHRADVHRCNAVAALRSDTSICGVCARVAAGTMLVSSRRATVAAGRAAAGAACSYTGTKQLTKS